MSLVVEVKLHLTVQLGAANRAVNDELSAPAILSRQTRPLYWAP
jgi:hypothetical protein